MNKWSERGGGRWKKGHHRDWERGLEKGTKTKGLDRIIQFGKELLDLWVQLLMKLFIKAELQKDEGLWGRSCKDTERHCTLNKGPCPLKSWKKQLILAVSIHTFPQGCNIDEMGKRSQGKSAVRTTSTCREHEGARVQAPAGYQSQTLLPQDTSTGSQLGMWWEHWDSVYGGCAWLSKARELPAVPAGWEGHLGAVAVP